MGPVTDHSVDREARCAHVCVCVSVRECVREKSLMRYHFLSGASLGVSIVEKGDIFIITAGSALPALDIIDIGLHTLETRVLSAASFEVRTPKSQNDSSHAISMRVFPATLTGHTTADTAGKLLNTRRSPACPVE